MKKKIKVRKAKKPDLKAINKMYVDLHIYLGKRIGKKIKKKELKKEKFKKNEIKNIFVAVDGKDVIALASFSGKIHDDELFGRHFELEHFFVDKRYRNRGIGKKLFAEIVKVAKTKKANIMTETPIYNKKIIGIYKKLGFKPVEFVLLYKTKR